MELVRLKEDKQKADQTYFEFNAKLEQSKKKLDDLHSAEKFLEKAFKKEMHSLCPNADYFDYLHKLFRGKKANLPKRLNANDLNNQSKLLLERRTSHQSTLTIATDSTSDRSFQHQPYKSGRRSVSKSLRNIQESVDVQQQQSELLLEHLKESEFEQYADLN